jgi:TRAP-type C4-dicarboxylate transport system substrate-binding protein
MMKSRQRVTGFALMATCLGVANTHAAIAENAVIPTESPLTIKFCVYDLMGAAGDIYHYAQDLALNAKKWHVNATIKAYTDERVAAEDFKAGQCDGLAISTLRAKQFNSFIGSIDSIGSAPTYQHIHMLVSVLNTPQIAPLTINGDYQVVTVMPLGAAYVMVNNRHIDSIEKAAGKKVAVMDVDKAQSKIVQRLGAQAVSTDIYNFANLFNNGQVDIITAPAVAFKPLELSKGLGEYGGIYRLPLTQMTGTILINRTRLLKRIPDLDQKIGKIREYALKEMDQTISYIDKREQEIPEHFWLDLPASEQARYVQMMREARLQLTQEGAYDPRMMALMKKVRCKIEPTSAECSMVN